MCLCLSKSQLQNSQKLFDHGREKHHLLTTGVDTRVAVAVGVNCCNFSILFLDEYVPTYGGCGLRPNG